MRNSRGFTLIELLVTTLLTGAMMTGVIAFYAAQNRAHLQQDVVTEVEQNLRGAMDLVTDAIRTSDYYGAEPFNRSNPSTYSSWLSVATPPTIVDGATAANPDSITVAGCYQEPLTTLASVANQSDSSIAVGSASGLAANDMLVIGQIENAVVSWISGNSVFFDTDPVLTGRQGLSHEFPAGAPVCRVEVITFAISGYHLTRSVNGAAAQIAVDGIADLQVSQVAPKQFDVTLRSSPRRDPVSGQDFTRELRSFVTISSWSAS